MIDIIDAFTIISVVVSVFGIPILFWQLREMTKAREADIIFRLHEFYTSREMITALNTLWDAPSTYEEFRKLYPKGSEVDKNLSIVSSFYSRLGFLVRRRIIEKKISFQTLSGWRHRDMGEATRYSGKNSRERISRS